MSEQLDQKSQEGDKQGGKGGIYFNGFNINNTLVDFQIELSLNNETLESYNMAPITAKNLAIQLSRVVEKYEQLTGTHIEAFNDLKEKTQEKMKENEELKKETEKKEKGKKDSDQKAEKVS